MSENKTRTKDNRARHWTFVVYPESLPINWRDIMDEEHIPWIESPLHDRDVNEDGEIKKPHIHIFVTYEGKKSFNQVQSLTERLNAPIPQVVASPRGLVRYMLHMDNPEKYQYDRALIIGHGGADVAELLKPTSSNRYQLIGEMREWVKDNDCIEFFVLFDHAAAHRFDDWFPLLCDNSAYIMGEYIKSRRFYQQEQFKN